MRFTRRGSGGFQNRCRGRSHWFKGWWSIGRSYLVPDSRKGRFGQRGGTCVLPTADPGISKIADAIGRVDSKASGRWAAPTGWPIVERTDLDNAAVDEFYTHWIRGFSEIDGVIDLTDSKAGGRWGAPTRRPIVERADSDNAAVGLSATQ